MSQPRIRSVALLAVLAIFTLLWYPLFSFSVRDVRKAAILSNSSTASTTSKANDDIVKLQQCPLAAIENSGLFNLSSSNSSVKDHFGDVILLVACNYAYYDMLQNWEYLAKQLNLKWAVLALDDKLYDRLGSRRAISPGTFSVPGPQNYREEEFNKLSCNKMRMVMSVVEHCDMHVVFSDVDNIFYHNPFEHDLGKLILSNRYDYIYQSDDEAPEQPLKDQCLHGIPRQEGNTGFYFVNRESILMKRIVNATLDRCAEPRNQVDDQQLFWDAFWKVKDASYERNQTFRHCDVAEYLEPSAHTLQVSEDSAFNFCCLDPYHYPVGIPTPPRSKDPITYHANWVVGKHDKVKALLQSRSDRYGWNESRISSMP